MFRRDTFVLLAAALLGATLTVYMAIGQTRFFPKSLETTIGDCPERGEVPAHQAVVVDDFEADWFGSSLLALQEQPLFPRKNDDARTIRLLVVESFDGPAMIRISETSAGRLHLTAKMSPGGRCADRRGCVLDRVLTEAEQAQFETAATPLLQQEPFGCDGGLDGSRWIVEASGRGDYRVWNAWTPVDGDVHTIGVALMDLTGWWPDKPSPSA